MSVKKEGKLTFLKDVLDAKEILFGAFSDKLTKEDKKWNWKNIHEKALALGLVPANKDYLYTRDTYWQNLKKYTMKKLDNKKQTGSGGGPDCKLTPTDNLILDIVGRDSPAVLGLPSTETWEIKSPSVDKVDELSGDNMGDLLSASFSTVTSHKHKKKTIPVPSTEDECEMRRKKLKLAVEIMEKESYLKNLEILKMERELGLPPSKFTKDFPMEVIMLGGDTFVQDEVEVISTEEN